METSRTCALASLTAAKSVASDATGAPNRRLRLSQILLTLLFLLTGSSALFAQEAGGEANLNFPISPKPRLWVAPMAGPC